MSSSSPEPGVHDVDDNEQHWGRELENRQINVESKRLYLDLKENKGGRVLKISQISYHGQKSRIFVAMDVMSILLQHLKGFVSELNAGPDTEKGHMLKSESFFDDTRQYYLDLKKNERGVFFRFTQISRARKPSHMETRQRIVLPSVGIPSLVSNLEELFEKYGQQKFVEKASSIELPYVGILPSARTMRVNKKVYYIDPSSNARGSYVRLSELHPATGNRSSITVPLESLSKLRDVLNEMCQEMAQMPVKDEP
ncbi:hypothetical protein L596_004338 [Steinernema carpocapsae]|uniref:Transcriptional activator protein Pur-alpha n=1 Tax=Steinernema carpocapsae TaxID=34508 RepID=A0A4U8UVP2_STECR|nr:hypothetical protein L596_004338 [Steinernema carpocapsae]